MSLAKKGKRVGASHPMWKGGSFIKNGYVYQYCPTHPYAVANRYVMQHRLVMESKLGRFLDREEIVHHINAILSDNRIENLMLFKNHSEHAQHHNALKAALKLKI